FTNITAAIDGVTGLAKAGTGELRLSAANTYSGTTLVAVGILTANNAAALGTSAVNVVSGTRLGVIAPGAYANNITLAGTGTDGQGALRFNSNLATFDVNGTITLAAS